MTELVNTLSDPAALAQFVAMVGGMAGLKKLACKMGLSGFAGAALSVKDGAETALRAYELAKELDGITYKSEVANAAPHVAKVMAELVQSLGFSAILRRIKCFAAGTQIVVAMTRRDDGSWHYETKAIEEIRVGDVVLARDEFGDTLELRRVLRTVSHSSDHLRVLEFEDASGQCQTIRTTDEHPFWVVGSKTNDDSNSLSGRFIPAQHLEVGQSFTGPNGERLTLIASRRDSHPTGIPVYNFEVDGFHTYFVGDRATSTPILAHNAGGCLPGANAADDLTPTHDHHTIPRQIRKPRNPNHESSLPPHLREHPDIVGRPGNPNRWTIFADEHIGPNGVHSRNRFPQGSYNERWKQEIDALRKRKSNWNDWTEQDILEIRDRLVKEFNLERYRPD